MRGSRKFFQRGSNFNVFFFCFFLVDVGREDPITTIRGPSSAGDIEMAFRWRADDGPKVNAGLVFS